MLLRMSVYCESWATMVTTAFKPSVCSCRVVSACASKESKAKESAAKVSSTSESTSLLSVVSTRVLSGVEISCPDTEMAEKIVKAMETKEKITATDLKFDNE